MTRNPQTARQAHLYRALLPVLYEGIINFICLNILTNNYFSAERLADWLKDVDARVQFGLNHGKVRGFIKSGDPVVVVTGWKQGAGFTNTMRIVYVSDLVETITF